jgi:hypothetical protein
MRSGLHNPLNTRSLLTLAKTLFVLICLVCWLGLTALSMSHHHDKDVKADDCSVCQVVHHQSADGIPPETLAPIALLIWVLIQHHCLSRRPPRSLHVTLFRSRAPPVLFT